MCAVLIWGYLEPRHQVSSSYKTCDRRIYKMAMIGTSRPGNFCCSAMALKTLNRSVSVPRGAGHLGRHRVHVLEERERSVRQIIHGPDRAGKPVDGPLDLLVRFNRIPLRERFSKGVYCRRFGCSTAIPMIIIIVVWVRKSYRRFPTTQIFPLELGALTIVSVNGGLIFFEEYAGKLDTNERCHGSYLTLRTMCQRCLSTRPTAEWGGWTGC